MARRRSRPGSHGAGEPARLGHASERVSRFFGPCFPSLDRSLSGFLDDLARGPARRTLIVMCGGIGRTPRISPISARVRRERLVRWIPLRRGDTTSGNMLSMFFFAAAESRSGRVTWRERCHVWPAGPASFPPSDLAATIFTAWDRPCTRFLRPGAPTAPALSGPTHRGIVVRRPLALREQPALRSKSGSPCASSSSDE